MKTVLLCVTVWLAAAAIAEEPVQLYWSEDFTRFNVGVAGGFGENCEIREENGRKYMHGTGRMLGNLAYFGAEQWQDYSFRFRFRFTQKVGFYPLVKSRGRREDADYYWYYVNIGRDRITFKCHGLADELAEEQPNAVFTFADAGLDPLEAGTWYTIDIRSTYDRISVKLAENGSAMKEVASVATVPGDGGVGILSYAPIDIADIVVRKIRDDSEL